MCAHTLRRFDSVHSVCFYASLMLMEEKKKRAWEGICPVKMTQESQGQEELWGECCYDTHCWHAAQVFRHRVTHVLTADLETGAGSAIWVSSLWTSGRGARATLQIQARWLLDEPWRQSQFSWVLIKNTSSWARLRWVVLEESDIPSRGLNERHELQSLWEIS